MHRRRLLIATLFCFAVIAAVVVLGAIRPPAVRVDVRLVDSVVSDGTNVVTAEFREVNRSAIVTDSLQLQFRVSGQWGSPEPSDYYQPHYQPTGATNVQNVVFNVPTGADACRFSLAYRGVGISSCRMYGFLYRHGLLQNSPILRSKIVHLVAYHPAMRHAQCELALPQAERGKLAAAN